jgi:hypothetical protein
MTNCVPGESQARRFGSRVAEVNAAAGVPTYAVLKGGAFLSWPAETIQTPSSGHELRSFRVTNASAAPDHESRPSACIRRPGRNDL